VSEWLKEHAWKVCILERVSRVRIPSSPQKISPVSAGFFHYRIKSIVNNFTTHGEMPERSIGAVSKTVVPAMVPRAETLAVSVPTDSVGIRIPVSPQIKAPQILQGLF
jgi:hypothetical protein